MRYIFNYEEFEKAMNTVGPVAEADSAIILSLGQADEGEEVQSVVRVTTSSEEIQYVLRCEKPDGYNGEAIVIAVKAGMLTGVVTSLAAFKEDIFVLVEDGKVSIGNSTTLVPIETLANIPQEMPAGESDESLMQFSIKKSEFATFIRRSLETTAPKDVVNGLSHGIMCVDTKSGKVRGLSFDGEVSSYATCNVVMNPMPEGLDEETKAGFAAFYEQMNASLEAYCNEDNMSSLESFYILIPTNAISHLKGMISDYEKMDEIMNVGVEKRRVSFVFNNNNTFYTLVQGRECRMNFDIFEQQLAMPSVASAQMDLANVLRSVGFLCKTVSLNGFKKTPIKMEINKDSIIASAGKDFSTKNIIKTSVVNGEGTMFMVAGDNLKKRLDALDKGTCCVQVLQNALVLSNGTLDEQSEYKMIVGLVNPEVWEKDEDEAEESADVETTASDDTAA